MTCSSAAVSRCAATRSPSRSSWARPLRGERGVRCDREAVRVRRARPTRRSSARRKPSFSRRPCQWVPSTGPFVRALRPSMSGGSPERDDPAVVDLVAAHRLAPGRADRVGQVLVRRRTRSPGRAGRGPSASAALHAVRIARCAARASGSRRRCPAPDGPAAACATTASARPVRRSQARSATVALRAGEDHEVGVGQPGRLGHVAHGDARLAGQRLGVGGVGDPRQPDDRHPQPLRSRAAAPGGRAPRRRRRRASPPRRATAVRTTARPRTSDAR